MASPPPIAFAARIIICGRQYILWQNVLFILASCAHSVWENCECCRHNVLDITAAWYLCQFLMCHLIHWLKYLFPFYNKIAGSNKLLLPKFGCLWKENNMKIHFAKITTAASVEWCGHLVSCRKVPSWSLNFLNKTNEIYTWQMAKNGKTAKN